MEREIRVDGHRVIRAPLHRVWQLLSRLESHPRYTGLWLTADLLERSQAAVVVEFRGFFGGLPITSVQRLVLRPPGRIEFKQVRGTLRGLWGAYLLKSADGDTDLHVEVVCDPGIVLFTEASVQQILTAHIDGMLTKIKASAERELVRVVTRRAGAAGEGARPAKTDEAPAIAGAREPEEADEGRAEDEQEEDEQEDVSPEPGAVPAAGVERSGAREGASTAPAEGRRRRRRRRRRRGGAARPPAPSG